MAVKLQCAQCPWSDERPAGTRPPSTCPRCGGNAVTTGREKPAPPAPAKRPAGRRRN